MAVINRPPSGSAAGPDYATLFRSREDYLTADGPTEVIHADLTNDGIDEVLVSDAFSDAFSVFQSANGDGVYEEVAGSPVSVGGFEPNGITTGFFNADAFLDVATANFASDNVSILLGNGDGTFGAPAVFAAGNGPEAVRAGDFDADSDLDLIVTNAAFLEDKVAVLLGNGNGTFGAASLLTVGTRPIDVQLGLFDADGTLDAVVTNNSSNTISILLGDGAGSFVPGTPATYATGSGPWGVRLEDFNTDDIQDIVVANITSDNASLFSGAGDGTFTLAATVAVGISPIAIDMADLNNDALLDIVTANQGASTVAVTLQTGGLAFSGPVEYSASTDPYGLFVDDINNDGLQDAVVASQANGVFSVFIGDGSGTLYGGTSHDGGNGEVGVAAGDFNQDGNADFAIGNSFADTLNVFAGDGSGGFSLLSTSATGDFPQAIASADLDGVNGPDIVVVNGFTNLVSVLLNNGSGSFAAPVSYTVGSIALPDPRGLTLGDLDGANGPDLAVVSTGSTGQLTIRLNNGNGTFAAPTIYSGLGGPTTVAIGNADGLSGLDVLVGNTFGSNFWALLNLGGGALGPAVSYASGGAGAYITAGDWNEDGLVDVVSVNNSGQTTGISLNSGAGVFAAPTVIAATGNSLNPHVADFNEDGNLDIIAAQQFPLNAVLVLMGDGLGNFTFGGYYGVGENTRYVAAVDLHGTGRPDVITTNGATNLTYLTNISGIPCVALDSGNVTLTVPEGETMTIELVLGSQPNHDVNVAVVADPSVQASPTSLRFTLGNWNIPQILSVTVPENSTVDGEQTVTVAIEALSDDLIFSGCNVPILSVIVQDNDVAGAAAENVIRIPGATPQEIAINISQESFAAGAAPAVVLARSENIVDSLTITPLAGLTHAALLVTNPQGLEPAVAAELQRLFGANISTRTVFLAGGQVALTPQVEADLRALGVTSIVRLGGAHRRETAQRIAEEIVTRNAAPTDSIILTEDQRFADALGAGAIAGKNLAGSVIPILLSVRASNTLDASVDEFLTEHPLVHNVEIIGGVAAMPAELATNIVLAHPDVLLSRVEGDDRFGTNANFNEKYASAPVTIVLANGEQQNLPGATSISAASDGTGFFAALLAGNFAAGRNAPLLITTSGTLPPAIDQYIQRHLNTIDAAYIVGSVEKVSQAIEVYLKSLL
jgi:hypothetical protein